MIVWIRYVNRTLLPQFATWLAPGGFLLCEQHLRTTANVVGPTSPLFRLEPGELRAAAQALDLVDYCEDIVTDPTDGRPRSRDSWRGCRLIGRQSTVFADGTR